MIESAVEMCLGRGYAATTVEAIAAAANVSPRTFSRYFATKDAVFVAVLDDIAEEVAAELRQLPGALGPLEAMRRALTTVLGRAQNTPFHAFSADRAARTIRVVTECDALRRAAIEYRGPQVLAAMAHRMGVENDDRGLLLAMTMISVTVVHAWNDMVEADMSLNPSAVVDQINRAFAELAALAADLVVEDQVRQRL